jgi:hypothetical protein
MSGGDVLERKVVGHLGVGGLWIGERCWCEGGANAWAQYHEWLVSRTNGHVARV